MNLLTLIDKIKTHPDFHKAGMILCHNGVARGTSRNGRSVTELIIEADEKRLNEIVAEMKTRPGIIDVQAHVNEGTISVGDDVMFIAVAGDFRENVFPVLREMIELVKRDVTKKTEI